MSRIDDLMKELCPEGVPFVALKEAVKIRNGKDYKHLNSGSVPVYGTGGVMTHVDTPAHQGPSVLLPRKGSLDKVYYVDGPFWNVDTIFATDINASVIHPKFFYYLMASKNLGRLNEASGVPSLTQKVLSRLRIPIPPMVVQEEIVRILDMFTQLEAELEAELEARRQQYEYYRDQLLTFDELGTPPPSGSAMDEIR